MRGVLKNVFKRSARFVEQIKFYAKRVKKERAIMAVSVGFVLLAAILVQSFSMLNSPDSTNAASNNDVIYGGVSSKQNIIDHFNGSSTEDKQFRALVTRVIGAGDEADAIKALNSLGGFQYIPAKGSSRISFGRNYQSGSTALSVGGTTFYYRTLGSVALTTNAGAYCGNIEGRNFCILTSCGNPVVDNIPPVKPPKPDPSATCDLLTATAVTSNVDNTQFSLKLSGTAKDGATLNSYGFEIYDANNKLVQEFKNSAAQRSISLENSTQNSLTYKIVGYINSSIGRKDSAACVKTVTVNPKQIPSYDLAKSGPTTAKPGGTVTYTLTFKNTGNTKLTNVVIKDALPSGVNYVDGSTTVDGAKAANGVTANGLNIGAVAAGKTVTIKFQAKMPAKDKLDCGDNKLVNKSSVKADQNFSENTDNNNVTTIVTRDCDSKYDLEKIVDKKSAKLGETLTYTLKFTNTGEIDLTNVIIKDSLPAEVTWTNINVSTVNTEGNPAQADLKNLFSGGLKFNRVKVGGTITIKITVKVKNDAVVAEICGKAKSKTLTNKSSVMTDQKDRDGAKGNNDETNPNNNDANTTVTVDCVPKEKCPTNPKYDKDDERCKPCEWNPNLNQDDPECQPPSKPKCEWNDQLFADDENCKAPEVPTEKCATNPSLDKDDKHCQPCPYNEKLNYDDPLCEPYAPEKIVSSGPTEFLGAVIGGGALTFGAASYIRSRRNLVKK